MLPSEFRARARGSDMRELLAYYGLQADEEEARELQRAKLQALQTVKQQAAPSRGRRRRR